VILKNVHVIKYGIPIAIGIGKEFESKEVMVKFLKCVMMELIML